MDNPFENVNGVSEQELHKNSEFLTGSGKSIAISQFEDSIQSEESFLKVNFRSQDEVKEIIVEKLDDYIEENQFSQLSIIGDHSNNIQQYDTNSEHITCNANDSSLKICDKSMVIKNIDHISKNVSPEFLESKSYTEIELSSNETVFHNTDSLSIKCTELTRSKRKEKKKNEKSNRSNLIKKRKNIDVTDTDINLLTEHFYKRRKIDPVKIDKQDPRSLLHFVKFLKRNDKHVKVWECGICSKEFIHQYTLMRHLPIHTDERNFKCEECGKAFRQWSTLTQHKVIHSEHRPYVCDICQKTFSRVSTLSNHKKTHTQNKSYVCDLCGKGFHQRINLKNHLHTHSNIKPYKCDLCNKGFNQASNLANHKYKTHSDVSHPLILENNRYKCSLCPENFTRRAALRQHEHYIHGIKNVLSSQNCYKAQQKNSILKKTKIGNIHIIPISSSEVSQKENTEGILIDPIETKALHRALNEGVTPFALLKPLKNAPVVVKVKLCTGGKHMLVPASADELREIGKFSVSDDNEGRSKAVQIKVPVVATVHQKMDKSGAVRMEVEPPLDEESTRGEGVEPNFNSPFTHSFTVNPSALTKPETKDPLLYQNQSQILLEGIEYTLPNQPEPQLMSQPPQTSVDLLATAVNVASQNSLKADSKLEPIGENLMTLANQLQFLRTTEKFEEFEIVDVGGGSSQLPNTEIVRTVKPPMDDNPTDQFWLMDALQNIQYEEDGIHQIILNSVDDTVIVDEQAVQMVINNNCDDLQSASVDVETVDPLEFSLEKP